LLRVLFIILFLVITNIFAVNNIGTINTDKITSNSSGDIIIVTLNDIDIDTNVSKKDIVEGKLLVRSSSDSSGFFLTLEETDINSGIFTTSFTTNTSESNTTSIKVKNGDVVAVHYYDDNILARVDIVETLATLDIGKFANQGSPFTIALTEPDGSAGVGTNSLIKDTINVRVSTESDLIGFNLQLLETDLDSKVFKSSVTISTETNSSNLTIKANYGEIIKVSYADLTDNNLANSSTKVEKSLIIGPDVALYTDFTTFIVDINTSTDVVFNGVSGFLSATTSNSTIIDVNTSGNILTITGRAEGTDIITVTDNNDSIQIFVTVNSNLAIDSPKYKLTLNNLTDGIIKVIPFKSSYSQGTSITIVAVANDGYKFLGWSGGVDGNISPKQILLTNDTSFGAEFIYDTEPPKITLISPANGNTITGDSFKVLSEISNNVDLNVSIQVYVDNKNIGFMGPSSKQNHYQLIMDTCTFVKGEHTIKVSAVSYNGIVGESSNIEFNIEPCRGSSTKIFVSNIENNSIISDTVDVQVTTLNLPSIKKAILYIDNEKHGRILKNLPLSFKLMTSVLENKNHTLKVEVTDNNDIVYESNTIAFLTNNDKLKDFLDINITSPAENSNQSEEFNVTINSFNGEKISRIDLYLDNKEIWFITRDLASLPKLEIDIPIDLSGINSGKHFLKAYAEFTSGYIGYSKDINFTVITKCLEGMECYTDATYILPLQKGWNLTSLPFKNGSSLVYPFTKNMSLSSLFLYSVENGWLSYIKDKNLTDSNQVSVINQGNGFWINSLKDTNVTFKNSIIANGSSFDINYSEGWNLLASPKDILLPTSVFNDCKGVKSVWVYRKNDWYSKFINGRDEIFQIAPLEGFWLSAFQSAICK